MEVILVTINFPSIESARQIGTALIEGQLAACVNIIPGVESIYRWEGKLCTEKEVTMVVKTTVNRFAELEERVLSLHPYDVPEVVGQKLDRGSEMYLKWVQDEVGK